MFNTPLDNFEISLIKTMLRRGMRNADIQFYFNRPNRMVNNGRISEIKSRKKGRTVKYASEFEVDEFINNHPLTKDNRPIIEPEFPQQNTVVSMFTVQDGGKVDMVPDPPTEGIIKDATFIEIYLELKQKIRSLLDIGHNGLGDIAQQATRLELALPDRLEDIRIVSLWSRGNTLRTSLRAHDKASISNEPHPAKLDPLCAERLRDVVDTFNILMAAEPRGTKLDQQKLGPAERDALSKGLAEIRKALIDAKSITTPEAQTQIEDQLNSGMEAPLDAIGDNSVSTATGTSQNFILTLIKSAYWTIRKLLSKDMPDILKKARMEGYAYVGKGIALAIGVPIINYLAKYAIEFRGFLQSTLHNETLQNLLDLIANIGM